MSDKKCDIDAKTDVCNGTIKKINTDMAGGVGPSPSILFNNSSRRTSNSSQHSLGSCTSPNYDSGNFSCSNNSDASIRHRSCSSTEDDADSTGENLSVIYTSGCCIPRVSEDVKELIKELKDKDKTLKLAVHENKKYKSDLERLTKSEKWYKVELKNQKRSRLDLLEKLYLNERRFITENQQLKADCARLYNSCEEIERKALNEKDSLVKQLQQLQSLFESAKCSDGSISTQEVVEKLRYELQREKGMIKENENLIDLLRKQKHGLLEDIRKLTTDRDSKLIILEANTFNLSQENERIADECTELKREKDVIADKVNKYEETLENIKIILNKREDELKSLRHKFEEKSEQLEVQTKIAESLKLKISQIETEYSMQNAAILDNFKTDLDNKNIEIINLKSFLSLKDSKISALELEVLELKFLKGKLEDLQNEIDTLKAILKNKELEINNLEAIKINQAEQISSFKEHLTEYQKLRENFDKYVNLLQSNTETLEIKQEEVERLTIDNEILQKETDDLRCDLENRNILLERIKDDFQNKEMESKEIMSINEAKSTEISKIKEKSTTLSINLDKTRLSLLENIKTLQSKEQELQELKCLTNVQAEEIFNLNKKIDENMKFGEKLEQQEKVLLETQKQNDELKLIISNQNEKITNLSNYPEKLQILNGMLEKQKEITRTYSLDLETLQLVVRGQNAQLQRISNRENEENQKLKEKLEEITKLLEYSKSEKNDVNKELENLKLIAKKQSKQIEKLTIEKQNEKIIFNIDEFKKLNCRSFSDSDIDLKINKIEMLKTLLDEKADHVQHLNDEQEKWSEILQDLTNTTNLTAIKDNQNFELEKFSIDSYELEDIIKKYEKELKTKSQEIEALSTIVAEQNEIILNSQSNQQDLKDCIIKNEEKLMCTELELETRNYNLGNLKKMIDEQTEKLRATSIASEIEIENLNKTVLQLQEESVALKNALKIKENEVEELKISNNDNELNINKLQTNINVLENELDNLKDKLKNKENEIETLQISKCNDFKNFEQQREHFEHRLKIKKKEFDLSQKEIQQLSECCESQEMEILNLHKKFVSLRKQNDKIQSDMKDELQSKIYELKLLQIEKQKFTDKISFYKQKIEDYEKEKSLKDLLDKEKCVINKNENNNIHNVIKELQEKQETFEKVPENCDTDYDDDNDDITTAKWKILQKVMETEHNKRIARYELHIRSLLANAKSYKKNLEMVEHRLIKLVDNCKIMEIKLKEKENEMILLKLSHNLLKEKLTENEQQQAQHNENLFTCKRCSQYFSDGFSDEISENSNKRESYEFKLSISNIPEDAEKLHEISKKYEVSQRTVAILKHQLETARKQFMEMDDYKRLSLDLKSNLKNLIDDYKKIITPLSTYKPPPSYNLNSIYELIERSNNLVPNFDVLSDSIEALKYDIKLLTTCSAGRLNSTKKRPSLLDELKAADCSTFS